MELEGFLNSFFMSNFFLQKNISLPWEVLSINWDCNITSEFNSENEDVWIITKDWSGYSQINVVWIGETNIISLSWTCDNTWILLVSTEDGKQPFMTHKSYDEYTNYELIFVFFTIFIIFILRLWKI